MASSPTWSGDSGEGADRSEADLVAFVQGLGSNEERLNRILCCADAPWRLCGGSLPDAENPLWSCCAFALWCLLKIKPKPSRLANLRLALPAVIQGSPYRARWLAAEVLLVLQLQAPATYGDAASSGIEALAETTYQERAAMELALRE